MEGRNSAKFVIYRLFVPTASCGVWRILRRFTRSLFLWCSSRSAAIDAGPLMSVLPRAGWRVGNGLNAILAR
jgi:hypothetical protein